MSCQTKLRSTSSGFMAGHNFHVKKCEECEVVRLRWRVLLETPGGSRLRYGKANWWNWGIKSEKKAVSLAGLPKVSEVNHSVFTFFSYSWRCFFFQRIIALWDIIIISEMCGADVFTAARRSVSVSVTAARTISHESSVPTALNSIKKKQLVLSKLMHRVFLFFPQIDLITV